MTPQDEVGTNPGVSLGDVKNLAIWRSKRRNKVVNPFKRWLSGVHLDNDPVALHKDFRDNAAG